MNYSNIVYTLERLHAELSNKDNEDFLTNWLALEEDLTNKIAQLHGDNDTNDISTETSNQPSTSSGSDHQTDPAFVKVFIDLADSELILLRSNLDELAKGEKKKNDIYKTLDSLTHASESMHYTRIVDKLDKLRDAVDAFNMEDEKTKERIGKAELQLREEFTSVFNVVDIKNSENMKDEVLHSNNASSVFILFYARQAKKNIVQLKESIDKIKSIHDQLKEGVLIELDKKLFESTIKKFKNLYHSSVFYSLNTTAQLTLILEDLFSRIYQGEFTISQKLVDVSCEYVAEVHPLFSAIEEKKTIKEDKIEALLTKIKSEIFTSSSNELSQITERVLSMINIDPGFHEVLTPENIVEISEHLQNGYSFYNLMADLEKDENIGMQFYEICNKESIFPVSNVTVYQDDKTMFLFLLATSLTEDEIFGIFNDIDSSQSVLKLSSCTLQIDEKEEDHEFIDNFFDDFSLDEEEGSGHDELEYNQEINMDDIDIMDSVGQLVTAHSALAHLTEEIGSNQLGSILIDVVKQAEFNSDVNRKIHHHTEIWSEEIRNKLNQIMSDFASSLDHLKDLSIQLRNSPIKKMVEPLTQLIRDTAFHLDKKVNFDITGQHHTIDKAIISKSNDDLKSILWFILVHSIEDSSERKAQDKPLTATIQLSVNKFDDHIEIAINEDGRGFTEEKLKMIADSNGLSLGDYKTPTDLLLDNRLKQEVMINDNAHKGISFSEINHSLQKANGFLKINKSKLGGNEYVLSHHLTSVVIEGMVVKLGNINYVIPIKAIRRILKPEDNMISHFSSNGGKEVIKLDDEIFPIISLSAGCSERDTINPSLIYVIIEHENEACAFSIDELIGQQQVLVHPLQGYLAEIDSVSGCAILAGGKIGMVIDVEKVVTSNR